MNDTIISISQPKPHAMRRSERTRFVKTRRVAILATFVISIHSSGTLSAKSYYVSSSAGSDSNSGTSISTPWKSIGKLNGQSLQPGDSVLFKRGDVFFGEVAAKPGSIGKTVFYGAYGDGSSPIISGAISVGSSGWSVFQGSVLVKHSVTMRAMDNPEQPVLFFNDIPLMPARYPNTGILRAQTVTGGNPGSNCCEYSVSLSDPSLGAMFPVSSELESGHVTGYDPYGISTRKIRSYDPSTGTIRMDTLRGIGFINSKEYFLSCALRLLDSPGEWYYDSKAKDLYVWFPGGSPPGIQDTILYSSSQYGINAWQVDNLHIADLEFRHQQIAGIWLVRNDNILVEHCRFSHAKHGLIIWGTDGPPEVRVQNLRVAGNTFDDLFRTGINSRNLENCAIEDNRFHDIGLRNGFGQSPVGDQWNDYGYYAYGLGIQTSGVNSRVSRNTFLRSGRQAISSGGRGFLTQYNLIDSACMNYNDCGGIMPLGYGVVQNNIIRNCVGPDPEHRYNGARGIYPDFREYDTIRNNTIDGCVMGIGLTNAKHEIVSGNIVYGSSFIQFRMNKKNTPPLNNTVIGNTFFGLDDIQYSLQWDNFVTEVDASTLDSNRYWNPYLMFPTIRVKKDSVSGESWYDLPGWQLTGRDKHSSQEFLSFNAPYSITDTTGVNVVRNADFESGSTGWSYSDSMTVVSGVLVGNCLRMKKNSTGSKTLTTTFTTNLDTSRFYVIGFTIMDPSNIGRAGLRVRENGGSGAVYMDRYIFTKSTPDNHWMLFKPAASTPPRIEFISSNSTWYLDNVNVYPVSVQYDDPRERFPLFVNDTYDEKTFDLGPRFYLDLDSNLVTGRFTLGPCTSRILVALDSSVLSPVAGLPLPADLDLRIYPNPAHAVVDFGFRIVDFGCVSLRVVDVMGRTVATVAQGMFAPGSYHVQSDVSRLARGIYFAVLSGRTTSVVRMMVVVR